jgi:cytochrome c5
MPIYGANVPKAKEVKWYAGGEVGEESHVVTSGEVTTGYFDLAGTAEFCSVLATVTPSGGATATKAIEELQTGGTAATDITGTQCVKYTGMAKDDVVALTYVKTSTVAMTQVAACDAVRCSSSAETTKAAVHGQSNKISTIGASENTATFDEFYYSQAFAAMCHGEQWTGTPSAGKKKWSNLYQGMNKIGSLVGKRYNQAGTLLYKWFLFGAQATGVDADFPVTGFYKKSVKFDLDAWIEADLA